MEEAERKKADILLMRVIDWYDNRFLDGELSAVISDIREYLKEVDKNETTSDGRSD